MSEFISKVAKLAVSKAAGFGYAVAVGVAGNLAFHYVQPPEKPVATPAALTTAAPETASPADAVTVPAAAGMPRAPAAHGAPAAATARVPPPAAPAVSPRPSAAAPVAALPTLPEPPAEPNLPRSEALPSPAFKPLALPKPAASEAAVHPAPEPQPAAVEEPPPAKPAATAALPPLDPPIEVAAPPTPPAAASEPVPAAVRVAPPTALPQAPRKDGGLEISDIWHPGRAVDKSLHWAGRQLPLIGDADAKPHPAPIAAPRPAAPISLLPADNPDTAGNGEPTPAKPSAPGPGRGGLY